MNVWRIQLVLLGKVHLGREPDHLRGRPALLHSRVQGGPGEASLQQHLVQPVGIGVVALASIILLTKEIIAVDIGNLRVLKKAFLI